MERGLPGRVDYSEGDRSGVKVFTRTPLQVLFTCTGLGMNESQAMASCPKSPRPHAYTTVFARLTLEAEGVGGGLYAPISGGRPVRNGTNAHYNPFWCHARGKVMCDHLMIKFHAMYVNLSTASHLVLPCFCARSSPKTWKFFTPLEEALRGWAVIRNGRERFEIRSWCWSNG